jgi:Raf kinase inhibitor-like YbhB/YbcL family protein
MRNLIKIMFGLIIATSALAGDFTLKSTAFSNNQRIPVLYTCNGENISPPLSWDNVPPNTKSFVLILNTPDYSFTPNLWIIYNIPENIKNLKQGANENLPAGTQVGTNYFYEEMYDGPCPPDKNLHHYVFTLYALDATFDQLENGIDPVKLLASIKSHILKQTELSGVYSH